MASVEIQMLHIRSFEEVIPFHYSFAIQVWVPIVMGEVLSKLRDITCSDDPNEE